MLLDKLKPPVKLIHPDLRTIEIVDNINYLRYQTQLGVKEQSLLNCFIEDNCNNYYRIVEIIDKGRKSSYWKFTYFNPMKKIELKFSLIEDKLLLNKLRAIKS